MPEGDSVYKEARRLEPALQGRTLTRGELRVPAHATDDLAGYTVTEVAEALGVAESTADLDWRFARAWLLRALSGEK